MDDIIPGAILLVLILAVSAVIILRPLSKRLADLLEMRQRERVDRQLEERVHRELRELSENLGRRLDLLEQRLDFTESLVQAPRPDRALGRDEPERTLGRGESYLER